MKIKINNFSSGLKENVSDSLKDLKVAKRMENFSVKNGALKPVNNLTTVKVGNGDILEIVKDLDFSNGEIFVYKKFDFNTNSRVDKLIFFDSDFVGYYIELSESEPTLKPLGITTLARPTMINYRLNGEDVLIITSEKDNMVVWDGVNLPEIVVDAPKIKSMDIHYERLFAVSSGSDGTELRFSDDLDPTNWSESLDDAGFISLVDERGKLLKVVSFNDYLYIFRERGITRLYANTALQTSFYVNQLFTSGGRIIEGTIAVSGDHILFLATDGFYRFDGANTTKILDSVFPLIFINGKEKAVYFNGKYILACAFDEKTTYNNTLLIVNESDLSVEVVKGFSPSSLTIGGNEEESYMLVLGGEENYPLIKMVEKERADEPIELLSLWRSVASDFGLTSRRKTIRKFEISMENPLKEDVYFSIFNELGESVRFVVNSCREVRPIVFTGLEFSFLIETRSADVEIGNIELEVFGG